DAVAHRRGDAHGARLTHPGRWLRRVADDVDLDRLGRVAECRDRIGVPSAIRDTAVAVMDLLKERPRRRLLDAALRLIADTIGIQGRAGINGRPDLHQPGSTV